MGLFCKRALKKRQYSAKETYNLKPTNLSQPIVTYEDVEFSNVYFCDYWISSSSLLGTCGIAL